MQFKKWICNLISRTQLNLHFTKQTKNFSNKTISFRVKTNKTKNPKTNLTSEYLILYLVFGQRADPAKSGLPIHELQPLWVHQTPFSEIGPAGTRQDQIRTELPVAETLVDHESNVSYFHQQCRVVAVYDSEWKIGLSIDGYHQMFTFFI